MVNFKNIGILLVVLALVIVIAGCASNTAAPAQTTAPPSSTQQSPASQGPAPQAQKIKLSDTGYWAYAHLVSGDTLDSAAQEAMVGFIREKKTLSDGTTQVLLKATDPGYKDHTYILKQGEQLYFIETSMGDDSKTQEFSLGDDTAVVVDSQGYIVG
jgi:hypothetical protein